MRLYNLYVDKPLRKGIRFSLVTSIFVVCGLMAFGGLGGGISISAWAKTDTHPEVLDGFNKWYDEVHIPMMLEFKELKGVTRYKLIKSVSWADYPDVKYPEYLTIYNFESEEAADAWEASPVLAKGRKDIIETWSEPGYERLWRVQYKALKTWRK